MLCNILVGGGQWENEWTRSTEWSQWSACWSKTYSALAKLTPVLLLARATQFREGVGEKREWERKRWREKGDGRKEREEDIENKGERKRHFSIMLHWLTLNTWHFLSQNYNNTRSLYMTQTTRSATPGHHTSVSVQGRRREWAVSKTLSGEKWKRKSPLWN